MPRLPNFAAHPESKQSSFLSNSSLKLPLNSSKFDNPLYAQDSSISFPMSSLTLSSKYLSATSYRPAFILASASEKNFYRIFDIDQIFKPGCRINNIFRCFCSSFWLLESLNSCIFSSTSQFPLELCMNFRVNALLNGDVSTCSDCTLT